MSDADRILRLETELESMRAEFGRGLAELRGQFPSLLKRLDTLDDRLFVHQGAVPEIDRLREDVRSLRSTLDTLLLGRSPEKTRPED